MWSSRITPSIGFLRRAPWIKNSRIKYACQLATTGGFCQNEVRVRPVDKKGDDGAANLLGKNKKGDYLLAGVVFINWLTAAVLFNYLYISSDFRAGYQ